MRLFRFYFLILISTLFLGTALPGIKGGNVYAAKLDEYQIKAAFLYNLTNFTTWPADATDSPVFAITILGKNPFGDILEKMVQQEKVNGKPVVIHKVSTFNPSSLSTNILFICRDKATDIPDIIDQLTEKPVLTVADSPGFLYKRGMINLIAQGRKVHLEINPQAVSEANLSMNARLLRLARTNRSTWSQESP